MLNRSGDRVATVGIFPFSSSRGKAFCLLPFKYDVKCGNFMYALYQVEELALYAWLPNFDWGWMLDLPATFSVRMHF